MSLFGKEHPQKIPTDFVRLSDDGGILTETGMLTWYDARARHPTRSEFRLYYYNNTVTATAREGDFLLIGKRYNGSTLVLMAPGSGLAAARIAWLFGIEVEPGAAFAALNLHEDERSAIGRGLGIDFDVNSPWESEVDPVLEFDNERMIPAIREVQRLVGVTRASDIGNEWPSAFGQSEDDDGQLRSLAEITRLLGGLP
ncbi:hypothetical protein [Rhizobium sp. Leaf311]|uniref:hypothetical protein n=1 Tax=Rhizobium sp. Leaf311 TaxID=1736332 RepID=UPI0012E38C41|nr:hypothetical protein [Rhizobium sp. Leaf311]